MGVGKGLVKAIMRWPGCLLGAVRDSRWKGKQEEEARVCWMLVWLRTTLRVKHEKSSSDDHPFLCQFFFPSKALVLYQLAPACASRTQTRCILIHSSYLYGTLSHRLRPTLHHIQNH